MRQIGKVRALGVAVAFSALVSTVSADEGTHVGDLCNPTIPTDAAKLTYGQSGVSNTSSSSAKVSCGARTVSGQNVSRIWAVVFDRNAAASADVCCTMILRGGDGNAVASAVKCSTGSSQFTTQYLFFDPPANLGGAVTLQCTIPGTSGGIASGISTYGATSAP